MTNIDVTEGGTPTCSACGGSDRLFFVTAGVAPGTETPGRALVYCGPCRGQVPPRIASYDIAVPIGVMDPELLLKFFALQFTDSDPAQACEIVFGRVNSTFVATATEILKTRTTKEAE